MADPDLELALAVRELVRSVDAYRGGRAADVGGVAVTDIVALGHLYVQGSHTPTDLARHLQVTTASITELLDRLEKRAWVSREPHPHDRRRIVVNLTGAGRELIAGIYREFGSRLAPAFDTLDPGQRQTVLDFLRTSAVRLADTGQV